MSFTSFDFPHTHFYESDLRELIAFYKELLDKYNALVADIKALQDWKEEHEGEYEELLERVRNIENEIDTFESEVERMFADLDTSIHADFNALKEENQRELQSALAEFTLMFTELRTELESDIASMKIEIANLINYLNDQIANINQNVIDYVNDRLNDFIAHLPDYENLIVYNPVVGEQTNVQTAINDLYLMFAIYGITAEQYDSLQLTASEFDSKEISAKEYDMLAYELLGYPDPRYYMRDPFTGKFEENKIVILKLADLHRMALTASEYDALEIPAETFDGLQLTAYYFDWYGVNIGTSAITAQEYDGLEIEAEIYDDKRISAYDYDNYGKMILATI